MLPHQDRYWVSGDGLRLHARDWPGGAGRPPIVCLPGLTRNARDYAALAGRLAGAWRVVGVDFRGRGESAAARDPASYVPETYADDVGAMLDELEIDRFVLIGTSLGGIVAMLLATRFRGRVAAAVLNDVGPVIEAAGMERIRGHVGRGSSLPTWMHAARCLAESNREVYPGWAIEDWLDMAKRLYRLNSAGRVVLDYDMRIAEPFRVPVADPAPDLWAVLGGLATVPTLVVRGGRSDVLSDQTAFRMVARLERGQLVTVANVGHAPTLVEPMLDAPIDALLAHAREPVPG